MSVPIRLDWANPEHRAIIRTLAHILAPGLTHITGATINSVDGQPGSVEFHRNATRYGLTRGKALVLNGRGDASLVRQAPVVVVPLLGLAVVYDGSPRPEPAEEIAPSL